MSLKNKNFNLSNNYIFFFLQEVELLFFHNCNTFFWVFILQYCFLQIVFPPLPNWEYDHFLSNVFIELLFFLHCFHYLRLFPVSPLCLLKQKQITLYTAPHVLQLSEELLGYFYFSDADIVNIISKPYLLATRLSCSAILFHMV